MCKDDRTGFRTPFRDPAGLIFLLAVLLSLLCAGAARSGPAEEAFAAANAGDYPRAIELWTEMANGGDAVAQFNLGVVHDEGLGIDQDSRAARAWWQKASDQGLPAAMHTLALLELELAETGDGDIEAARRLLEAAVAKGHAPSAYTLGKMLLEGAGAPPDVAGGIALIRRAAEAGFDRAQYNMGKAYRDGTGVEADPRQAADWFRQAALQGYASAQGHFARRLAEGDGIAADLVNGLAFALLAARQGSEPALELAEDLKNRLSVMDVSRAVGMADTFRPGSGMLESNNE